MYTHVRAGDVPERDLTKEEKKRERCAKKIDKKKEEEWGED